MSVRNGVQSYLLKLAQSKGMESATRFRTNRTISIILGLVLLVTAGLKLYGMNISAMPQVGVLLTEEVRGLVICWELLLGTWLIWGVGRVVSWLATFGTFLTFALVSVYLGVIGQATCGCFGDFVEASPWHAFAVDLGAIVALVIIRPSREELSAAVPAVRKVGGLAAAVAAILVGLALGGWALFGSVNVALAKLRGAPFFVTDYLDFGRVKSGSRAEGRIDVTNLTNSPLRLIGGTSSCSCVATTDLPLTIAPGETRPVTLLLKTPFAARGIYEQRVKLWTDNPDYQWMQIRVGCWLVE